VEVTYTVMHRTLLFLRLVGIACIVGAYGGNSQPGDTGGAPPVPNVDKWIDASCADISIGIRKTQAMRLGLPNRHCSRHTAAISGTVLVSERFTSDEFGFRFDFVHSQARPGLLIFGDDATNRQVTLAAVNEWQVVAKVEMRNYLLWQALEVRGGWHLQYFQIRNTVDPVLHYQCISLSKYGDPVTLTNAYRTRYIGYYCALSQFPLMPADIELLIAALIT